MCTLNTNHSISIKAPEKEKGFFFRFFFFQQKTEGEDNTTSYQVHYYPRTYRGTSLNAMKRFCICSLMGGGCSEGLGAFIFFFKRYKKSKHAKSRFELKNAELGRIP